MPGAGWPHYLRERGYTVTEQPVDDDALQHPRDAVGTPRGRVLDAFRLRAAVLSEPRRRRSVCSAAARATRRAFSLRRSPPSIACARDGETRVGLLFVVGEERGSDGARAANRRRDGSPLPDRTASRPTTAWAGDARHAAC